MSLSDVEREKIRDAEVLKEEIRKELAPPPSAPAIESVWSKFFAHPATLLALGFILTTLVGSWLTYYWKHRDWTNQQSYLTQQRALDKKYALIDATFKEVSTTLAAGEDVLATYYTDNWSPAEIEEHRANWQKTSRNWRVASKVLGQNLAVNFSNLKIHNVFQEIVGQRKELGNAITNLPKSDPKVRSDQRVLDEVQKVNSKSNHILDLLHDCGALMKAETKVPPVE
jgi:hypothetical protein